MQNATGDTSGGGYSKCAPRYPAPTAARKTKLFRCCHRLVVVMLTVGASLSLLPRTAAAYCQTLTCQKECKVDKAGCPTGGDPLYWQKLPIVFRFHSRGSRILVREEARAAIRAAFHRWSDVICKDGARTSLRFREEEDVDEDKPLTGDRAPDAFGIFFRDFGWPHKDGDATLALTTHLFSKATGKIEYSDMEINTAAKRFAADEGAESGTDLQAVMTHEVGHYIGLAHSRADQSIMQDTHCSPEDDRCTKGKFAARRLAPDDIQAVCSLYPSSGYEVPESEAARSEQGPSCALAAPPTSSPASFATLLGAVLSILALVRRHFPRART